MRTLRSPLLADVVELPRRPRRIVSFVSGLTEALFDMGARDRLVGVSKYCSRYVDTIGLAVPGDYLQVDREQLRALQPDLVLMTGGVQLGLARRLAKEGFPMAVLPLPDSIHGILENILRLGFLLDEMEIAQGLVASMQARIDVLRASAPSPQPRVFVELWLGRHLRVPGGLTFINDLVSLAGGYSITGKLAEDYVKADLAFVEQQRPEVVVLFSEEDDHPVDLPAWNAERGWAQRWKFRLVESGITRGKNMIHDGPSILETATWLQAQFRR